MAIQSVRATHFSCYNMEAIIYNVQMSEQDNVPINLYLQKQAMGQICLISQSLLTCDLK